MPPTRMFGIGQGAGKTAKKRCANRQGLVKPKPGQACTECQPLTLGSRSHPRFATAARWRASRRREAPHHPSMPDNALKRLTGILSAIAILQQLSLERHGCEY